ncbi:MAG: helix-turn-helix domain-containing protein, partial [Pseudomonadota bacterium]|nr:helix-turn-helix domain-containing protein [Pseudomonadota bacterium]
MRQHHRDQHVPAHLPPRNRLTPYQFLLNTRLRQAALRLPAGPDAVSAAACDTGFGDLSTFNAAFRARFGVPAGLFRRDRASPCLLCHSRPDCCGRPLIPLVAGSKIVDKTASWDLLGCPGMPPSIFSIESKPAP